MLLFTKVLAYCVLLRQIMLHRYKWLHMNGLWIHKRPFAFTRDTRHLNEQLTWATLLIMSNQTARWDEPRGARQVHGSRKRRTGKNTAEHLERLPHLQRSKHLSLFFFLLWIVAAQTSTFMKHFKDETAFLIDYCDRFQFKMWRQ